MITIAIANHKGGVAKTTTTHALATVWASQYKRVLMIDMDPQSSLTEACGIDAPGSSMSEVLGGSRAGTHSLERVVRFLGAFLSLAPANIDMAATELSLSGRLVGRELVLAKALAHLTSQPDLVLIDCPPSLGMLTLNALMAADYVLIPTQPQIVDLRGLRLFRETLDQLRNGDGRPKELGVLLTFYDGRFNLHQRARDALRAAGFHTFDTMIGRSVRVAESPESCRSVIDYAPTNPRAIEYQALAQEVLSCLATH
jgi:chromosome partitioning protein